MTMNFMKIKPKQLILFVALPFFVKIAFVAFVMNTASASAAPAPKSFADLAEKLLPTVVNISSTQDAKETTPQQRRLSPFQTSPFPKGHPFNEMFDNFFDQRMMPHPQEQMPVSSLGSGFIMDKENGIIITNNHVIDGADEIKITLHNDRVLPAEIIGIDEKTDLAVLKANLKDENVNEAQFGDSDAMRVGDWVIAIGNPFGLGGTVTAGIISARQRDINSGPYDDYLQTDASINRGNSGGPMFNMDGDIIGINTAIFSPTGGSVGIGFAIPSVLAEPVIGQLQEFGRTRRGWLGVKIQDVTDEIAESLGLVKASGALVAEVTPTGPAEKAGIKSGDIILAFDNKPVREMRHLPRIVAETDIDSDVVVIVWRDGKRMTLKANIGELEKAEDEGLLVTHEDNIFQDQEAEDQGVELSAMGIRVTPLNDTGREIYNIDDDVKGLLVVEADLNSDAGKKGIDVGDVITDINQKPVRAVKQAEDEVQRAQKTGRESVLLLLNRQGSIQFVAVKLQSDDKE